MTRVLICDDHRLFADSLAVAARATGMEVVGVVDHPNAVGPALAARPAEVCVIDLQYRGGDAVEAIGRLANQHGAVRFVVLSGHLDDLRIAALRQAGVASCALKRGRLGDLLQVIERADHVAPLAAAPDPWRRDPLARFLTTREREVLEAIATGESTQSIGRRLAISQATVRSHVQSTLAKLGVHTRLEAVAYASSRGLIRARADRRGAVA